MKRGSVGNVFSKLYCSLVCVACCEINLATERLNKNVSTK